MQSVAVCDAHHSGVVYRPVNTTQNIRGVSSPYVTDFGLVFVFSTCSSIFILYICATSISIWFKGHRHRHTLSCMHKCTPVHMRFAAWFVSVAVVRGVSRLRSQVRQGQLRLYYLCYTCSIYVYMYRTLSEQRKTTDTPNTLHPYYIAKHLPSTLWEREREIGLIIALLFHQNHPQITHDDHKTPANTTAHAPHTALDVFIVDVVCAVMYVSFQTEDAFVRARTVAMSASNVHNMTQALDTPPTRCVSKYERACARFSRCRHKTIDT